MFNVGFGWCGNEIECSSFYFEALGRYEAVGCLRKTVGVIGGKDLPAEPSEEEFRLGLRSGIILCNVLNKVQPGAVSKVYIVHHFSPYSVTIASCGNVVLLLGSKRLCIYLESRNNENILPILWKVLASTSIVWSFDSCSCVGCWRPMWFCNYSWWGTLICIPILWECEKLFGGHRRNGVANFWSLWSRTGKFGGFGSFFVNLKQIYLSSGCIDVLQIYGYVREGNLQGLWIPFWHSSHIAPGNKEVETGCGNLVGQRNHRHRGKMWC